MKSMTVAKTKVKVSGKTVTLPVAEYKRLVAAAVPTYYLKGKAARDLDKLVEEGLRDYHAGKATTADSISSALKIYKSRHGR